MHGRPIPQAWEKGHLNPLTPLAPLAPLVETEQLKCALQVGETMKALVEYGNQVLPTPTDLAFQPGNCVYLENWKTSSP